MLICHDLRCIKCDFFHANQMIDNRHIEYVDDRSLVRDYECPKGCTGLVMAITWESGQVPNMRVKQQFLGDIWDKKGVDHNSQKFRDANAEAIKKGKRKR